MAYSITQAVKDSINRSPFISEMLMEDVISFSNLAKHLQPNIEARLGCNVAQSSIVMAIRRYAVELKEKKNIKKVGAMQYSISMQTGIYDVNFRHGSGFARNLEDLYSSIDPARGDFLNISVGNSEISLAVSMKHKELVKNLFSDLEITHEMDDLVAISIAFDGNYIMTPGLIYVAVRKLAWEQINIIEVISTMNYLSFVIDKENSSKAYSCLETLFEEER